MLNPSIEMASQGVEDMYCPRCGNEITEDSSFCGKCGTPVRSADALLTSTPVLQPAVVGAQAAGGDAPKPFANTRVIRIVCIVVAALVLIAAIVAVWLIAMNGKAHQTYSLRVNTVIAGTSIGDTSGVPLRIQGTDFESNPVDEKVLVTTDDYSVDLMRGNYTLTLAGDPVGDSGALYKSPSTETSVEVTEDEVTINGDSQDEEPGGDAEDIPELNMEFTAVPAEEITDELLQETREWMEDFGFDQEKTDEYITAATEHKQAELKRIAEEKAEALRKAAFGSFPADFIFNSGVGAWGSSMTINPDGAFEMAFHDMNMGIRGPGYNATVDRGEFTGSFTAVEQVNSKTFKLQLNELKSTHAAGDSIDSDGLRTIWDAENAYGLGEVTSSPRKGYTLYLAGTSKSSLPENSQPWLYDKPETLNCMVLVAPGGAAWYSD